MCSEEVDAATMNIDYIKCPTCGHLSKVENFLYTEKATAFWKNAQPASLSPEEEVALTLAGRIIKLRCSGCQDLYEMHGITR